MGLSLKNQLSVLSDRKNLAREIHLFEEKTSLQDGQKKDFRLDEWPILLFLKGEGFERVVFHRPEPRLIEDWAERIDHYQQLYIEDPEYFGLEEREWNEYDSTGDLAIECLKFEAKKKPKRRLKVHHVPPMVAPLGIDQSAVNAIINEVREQKPVSTLQRMISILNEFRRESLSEVSVKWSLLVGDIIATALENQSLEIAKQIAEDHRDKLNAVWKDESRRLRILSAYDPKANELAEWARVFESCPIDVLVETLEKRLSSEAGPQLIKLMSFRTKAHTEELIQYTLRAEPGLQKLMLQWLSPYWEPRHYNGLFNALITSLQREQLEMIPLWVGALIRSSSNEAFLSFEKVFENKSFFNRFIRRTSVYSNRSLKALLAGIEENVSFGSVAFLKRLKPKIQGDLADHVEKMINSLYKKGEV